jgi:hypothetical protein
LYNTKQILYEEFSRFSSKNTKGGSMKKLLLTVLIVAVTFSFVFAAAKVEMPGQPQKYVPASSGRAVLNEGFEGGGIPADWTVYDFDGDGDEWEAYSTTSAHTGSYVARIRYNGSGCNDWLITPQLICDAGTNDTLKFWYYSYSSSFLESFYVKVSTNSDVSDTTAYVLVDSVIDAPNAWNEMVVPLDAYDGDSVYVAVQCISVDEFYLYVDDFTGPEVYEPPYVPQPGDVILNELNIKTGSEWVELYNTTSVDIPLDSFHLMVASGPFDSILVGDTILANDYKVIYFPSNHLSNSGDSVGLYTINGTDTLLIDGVKYGNLGSAPVAPSIFYLARCGNTGNMGADWNMTAYSSEGAVNTVVGTDLGGGLIINEIDPYPTGAHDLVEIYNPTASAVNLLGYYLSDGDFFSVIVTSVTVDPGSWLTLEETVDWTTPMDFSSSDVAYLFRPDTTRIDQIGWYGEYNDFTFQRYTDGAGPNDGYDWISSGGGVTYFDALETWSAAN